MVSILIRPEGRMQLEDWAALSKYTGFQSSSGQKAECNISKVAGPGELSKFQSSSGQKAECNGRFSRVPFDGGEVSILIRPEGRMQLSGFLVTPLTLLRFQSSSGQKAECNPVQRGS